MPTPLVLESSATSDVVPPPTAGGPVVAPLHVVAQSVPTPTLTDGRPV